MRKLAIAILAALGFASAAFSTGLDFSAAIIGCDTKATAKDYIQDGLCTQFDGIENWDYGVHSTNEVRDLVTKAVFKTTIPSGEYGADHLYIENNCVSNQTSQKLYSLAIMLERDAALTNLMQNLDFTLELYGTHTVGLVGWDVNQTTDYHYRTQLGNIQQYSTFMHCYMFMNAMSFTESEPYSLYVGISNTPGDPYYLGLSRKDGVFTMIVYINETIKETISSYPLHIDEFGYHNPPHYYLGPQGIDPSARRFAFRTYTRALSREEMMHNAKLDRYRFGTK